MSENKINNISDRHVIEPGGFYFGEDEDSIYTLLGSCVAVTLWHPARYVAGMCHVVLSDRGKEVTHTRFASCAIKKFLEYIDKYNSVPSDYEVGVYGGGNMFPSIIKKNNALIGVKNIEEVEKLLLAAGFIIKYKNVGGEVARKLTLNRITGDIILEHVVMET